MRVPVWASIGFRVFKRGAEDTDPEGSSWSHPHWMTPAGSCILTDPEGLGTAVNSSQSTLKAVLSHYWLFLFLFF